MCTLALFLHQSATRPLVIAANRDEFYGRPATDPMRVADDPWIVAGTDLVAGGTWFGVNEHGLTVGILNRRTPYPIDPLRSSRGALCLDALRCSDIDEAHRLITGRRGDDYNHFNLLLASTQAAFVAQNHGATIAVRELPPGVHVLTNLDLNDPTCPRIAKSHQLFDALRSRLDGDPSVLVADLRRVLTDHSTPLDPRGGIIENLCVHLGKYGTRSSSIVIHSSTEPRVRYFHASGAPCENAYREVALPTP